MKVRFFSLSVVIFVLLPSAASAAEDSYTLMVWGDSLSAAYGFSEEQGWVTLLEEKLNSENWPYRVINGSVRCV